VSGALGVRIKATSEEREKERKVLREAKGKMFKCVTKFNIFIHFINYRAEAFGRKSA
jgi:hypothetical protein